MKVEFKNEKNTNVSKTYLNSIIIYLNKLSFNYSQNWLTKYYSPFETTGSDLAVSRREFSGHHIVGM